MGVCVLINLGASSRQMSIIPVNTTVGAEVSIHTFGAIGVMMLTVLVFLICSEHLFSIPPLFLCILLWYMMVDLQVVEGMHKYCKTVH